MASPVRARLIACILAGGEVSISQIAAELGRRPDSLYHHMRILERVGLIEQIGRRPAGRNKEAVFRAVAVGFIVDRSREDLEYREAVCRLMRQHAMESIDQLELSYLDSTTRDRVYFETINLRLTRKELDDLRGQFDDILTKFKARTAGKGERVVAVMLASPVIKP